MALISGPARGSRVLSRVPSPALVIGGIASVQTGAAIATTLFHRIGPGGAVLLRLTTASVILIAISRPRLAGRTRREAMLAGLFGVVLAGMNLAFYHAIQRIPLGVAVTIEFVGPLTVAVVGSRRRRDLLWILLAVLGILALLHGDTHALDPTGVLEALAAGALWGAYVVLSARLGRAFADGSGLALSMCVATVLAAPVGIAEAGSGVLAPHVLLLGSAVGVLSSAIPYSFEMEALRRIATHVFGVLMSLEPAMGALAGFIIVGQSLAARELAGILLVMVASLGASLGARTVPIDR